MTDQHQDSNESKPKIIVELTEDEFCTIIELVDRKCKQTCDKKFNGKIIDNNFYWSLVHKGLDKDVELIANAKSSPIMGFLSYLCQEFEDHCHNIDVEVGKLVTQNKSLQ